MKARKYDKRIKIYGMGFVEDGYGGTTPAEMLIGGFWAEAKQNSAFRDTAVGASDIKNNWSFNIRSTPKITPGNIDNLFVEYLGARFSVNDIRYADELRREINITANGISGNGA
jgi:head-tail adaptor